MGSKTRSEAPVGSEYAELAEAMVKRQRDRKEGAEEETARSAKGRVIRIIAMCVCLLACGVSWAPALEAEHVPPPQAVGAPLEELPKAQQVVRELWKVRVAFDRWRRRHQNDLPSSLDVLPASLRKSPLSNAPWIYEANAESGTYSIEEPAPRLANITKAWLDQRYGPPQVTR